MFFFVFSDASAYNGSRPDSWQKARMILQLAWGQAWLFHRTRYWYITITFRLGPRNKADGCETSTTYLLLYCANITKIPLHSIHRYTDSPFRFKIYSKNESLLCERNGIEKRETKLESVLRRFIWEIQVHFWVKLRLYKREQCLLWLGVRPWIIED